MCTNVCVFSCVPYATTDGAASAPQDAAPVTVVIVPGLKTYNPAMSSVPGFPFTPLASGSVPANPLYRWRTDYGTFALWNHSDGKVTDQGSDFAVGDTTVYLEYLTAPSDMSIPVRIQLDLVDGIGGELLASDELSLGWTLPATLTVAGSSGSGGSGGAIGSGGATGKGGAGGTGGAPECEATDAAVESGCANNSQCPANQYCDTQHCGSSCSCVGGYWLCTDVCRFSCVPYAANDGPPYLPQDAAPVTVAIEPGLTKWGPYMSSVPGFPFKPVASGSVPANPLYRWRTDLGTFRLCTQPYCTSIDQSSDFTVGDTTVYWVYLSIPSDTSILVWIHLDLIDGSNGEVLAASELSLGWSSSGWVVVQ